MGSGVYKIKGVGDVITGRVEQGAIISDEKDGLTETAEFTMQVAVQDHPGQLKAATNDEKSKEYRGGFCPIAFARTARARCSSSRSTGRWARSPPVVPRSRVPSSSRRTT